MSSISAHEAMRTRLCQRPSCREEAVGKSQWCEEHLVALGGTPPARTSAIEKAVGVMSASSTRPQEIAGNGILRCKDPDCAEVVTSKVGPYCYCKKHRDERGIPTGAGGGQKAGAPVATIQAVPTAPAPAPAPVPRPVAAAAPVPMTHEGRIRMVLATARRLDAAERKQKLAAAELARAKKAYRAAIAAEAGTSGVNVVDD